MAKLAAGEGEFGELFQFDLEAKLCILRSFHLFPPGLVIYGDLSLGLPLPVRDRWQVFARGERRAVLCELVRQLVAVVSEWQVTSAALIQHLQLPNRG